jgi:hypothetical protein
MNLRDFKIELLNKPTGRLILFLFGGGVILAFVLMHRDAGKTTKVTPAVPAQATTAKSYMIDEGIPDIKPMKPTPTPTPLPMIPEGRPVAVKTPPPIPQAIFAMKKSSLSENCLPYGRLLKCELVNTVDSINLETPIIGLVAEDVWRDGRLIIPAGTEVMERPRIPLPEIGSALNTNGCSSSKMESSFRWQGQCSTTLLMKRSRVAGKRLMAQRDSGATRLRRIGMPRPRRSSPRWFPQVRGLFLR